MLARESFFDPTFNGLGEAGWDLAVARALAAAYEADDAAGAAGQMGALLGGLGDPYTRWQPPREYEAFRLVTDGELQGGVGMVLALDPETRRPVVVGAIEGSPADRAGVMEGDWIEQINGRSTQGWSTERVASSLRGRAGTRVDVRLVRRSNQIPGVAGRPEAPPGGRGAPDAGAVERKRVALTRSRVDLNPVSTAVVARGGGTFGYLRLAQFSANAGADARAAVRALERLGVDGYLLDLRGNPGGVVDAAFEVSSLFLDGPAPVVEVLARDARQTLLLGPSSRPVTRKPLALLVDRDSASASEILAGALRDNRRALLLGEPTYGKGRIQSVYELHDGSALLVTVAQYLTPAGAAIDHVGLAPDVACAAVPADAPPPPAPAPSLRGEPVDRAPEAMRQALRMRRRQVFLQSDPCVVSGMDLLRKQLPGPRGELGGAPAA